MRQKDATWDDPMVEGTADGKKLIKISVDFLTNGVKYFNSRNFVSKASLPSLLVGHYYNRFLYYLYSDLFFEKIAKTQTRRF